MLAKPRDNLTQELKNIDLILTDHLHQSSLSTISKHRMSGHEFGWDSVYIVHREPSYRKRLVFEMLHIHQQKNSLNKQEDTEFFSPLYDPI